MTDIIDPSTEADPAGNPPAGGGSWRDGRFVRDGKPDPSEPVASKPTSKLLPAALLLALCALIVVVFGWWGLFIVGALGLSIVLHEAGHYLTAKQAGMKVTEFFVGFGPRIVSWRRGEVEYGVKALPLGAYVRIIGMNDLEEVDAADEGRTYREKGYWARLRVVLAGPAVNLALGFALLALIPMATGLPTNHGWSISKTVPDSGAAIAGVQPHDKLISFDGKPVDDFSKAFSKAVEASGGQTATLVVSRNGHLVTLHPTIGWILKSSAADHLAPLASGDTITKVADQPVSNYAEARQALHAAHSGKTSVEFLRDGTAYRTTVATPVTLPASGSQGFLGVFAEPRWARQNPVRAVGTAASSFSGMVTGSVQSIWHFFSPSGLSRWTQYVVTQNDAGTSATKPAAPVEAVNPGAPSAQSAAATSSDSPGSNRIVSIIGMLQLGSDAGHAGFFFVLSLLALINIFLGLINLLPLPPFDGGHAAVATYEAIREKISGRPYRADMAKLLPVTYAVLALMAFVFLSSSYLDLVHPARNPFSP